ncbi:MAG TPA: HigA family addiction module antitoxin [Planctomycetota bacterium]|nr:HigA family addiction module antitoxin [Planctomycetota bacterium]
MKPTHRIPTHPGIILKQEFLDPLGVSQLEFSAHLQVPIQRINGSRRAVRPETAWLLAQALGTTPEFWLNLQAAHDLAASRPVRRIRLLKRVG